MLKIPVRRYPVNAGTGRIPVGFRRTPAAAKATVETFAGIGVTEVVFDPTIASVDEVDRLADAVL